MNRPAMLIPLPDDKMFQKALLLQQLRHIQ
jgi:hypothetical protein